MDKIITELLNEGYSYRRPEERLVELLVDRYRVDVKDFLRRRLSWTALRKTQDKLIAEQKEAAEAAAKKAQVTEKSGAQPEAAKPAETAPVRRRRGSNPAKGQTSMQMPLPGPTPTPTVEPPVTGAPAAEAK